MQRMLKRGVETLKMEDYQMLYCQQGLAAGAELERLKIMSSSEYFVRLLPMPAGCCKTYSPLYTLLTQIRLCYMLEETETGVARSSK